MPTDLQRTDCRPFHGLELPLLLVPGVSLAKPRSTPGFMLAPAPQAKSRLFVQSSSEARREHRGCTEANFNRSKRSKPALFRDKASTFPPVFARVALLSSSYECREPHEPHSHRLPSLSMPADYLQSFGRHRPPKRT